VPDGIAVRRDGGHAGAVGEAHVARGAQRGEPPGEEVGVARLVARRHAPAHDPVARVGERGLDRHAFIGRLHVELAAELAHDAGRLLRGIELGPAGIEMQDAALELVVLDAGLGAQLAQQRAAVKPEIHDLDDVVAGAGGRAFAQELQPPRPLAPVGARAE
jgi:hypothetical protein